MAFNVLLLVHALAGLQLTFSLLALVAPLVLPLPLRTVFGTQVPPLWSLVAPPVLSLAPATLVLSLVALALTLALVPICTTTAVPELAPLTMAAIALPCRRVWRRRIVRRAAGKPLRRRMVAVGRFASVTRPAGDTRLTVGVAIFLSCR